MVSMIYKYENLDPSILTKMYGNQSVAAKCTDRQTLGSLYTTVLSGPGYKKFQPQD